MTNALSGHQQLLGQLGVPFDHLLKVGGGVHQHRYRAGESVVKVNSSRAALVTAPTGYVRLRLVADVAEPTTVRTADGLELQAAPPGHDGIRSVEVTWRTADRAAAVAFLAEGLGADDHDGRYRIGDSLVVIDHAPDQPPSPGRDHTGFRYLTVQVTDVEWEHQRILGLGHREGMAPVRLGDTAYISFVRDPDGNWIELSQRASLTGPLPDVPPGRLRS